MDAWNSPSPTPEPAVYVISGPSAAGKSTVARLLAARFERGVHIEGDVFRRNIVAGRAEPTPDMSAEAIEQLRLRHWLAASTADAYVEAGFTVAVEDVIAGAFLSEMQTLIRSRPCHVIVLLASVDAIAAREAGRARTGYGVWNIEELRDVFVNDTPQIGLWLDTTNLTAEETVDRILDRTLSYSGVADASVALTEHDPRWPTLFTQIADQVGAAMEGFGATVEHIGSTAVPGLRAKPIIDIDVVLRSRSDVPAAIERLRSVGYEYGGDTGIPGRDAFIWPEGAPPHHLHIVVANSRQHRDHIEFRDYLIAHPDAAREYGELKERLATVHYQSRGGYSGAKGDFIAAVLRAARREQPVADSAGGPARMASLRASVEALSAEYRASWGEEIRPWDGDGDQSKGSLGQDAEWLRRKP